jgi:hypothetical protein
LVDDFNADPTGVADSTAAFEEAAQYPGTNQYGSVAATVLVPSGQYRLTTTVDITRSNVRFLGVGIGNSPLYTGGSPASEGAASVIIWDGAAGIPMFKLRDTYHVTFENLRVEGKDSAPPSAIFNYNWQTGDAQGGSNGGLTLRDLHCGVYGWTTRGTYYGLVDSVLLIDGTNGNNDEFLIENCAFTSRDKIGTAIKTTSTHTQSVWSSIRSTTISDWAIGVQTAATYAYYTTRFNACGIDLDLTSTNTAFIYDWQSELSNQLVRMGTESKLVVKGGRVMCSDLSNVAGSVIDAFPTDGGQKIHIEDVEFFDTLAKPFPANANIIFGPQSSLYSGAKHFSIKIEGCRGLHSDKLTIGSGGSLSWATNTVGTVEWDNWHETEGHVQWRNEFRGANGTGTAPFRNAIDKTVWDGPGSYQPRYLNWASCINGPAVSGAYLQMPHSLSDATTGAANTMYAASIMVDRTCTINQLSTYVTTAGSAGDVVRLGIYNDLNGKPGTRVLDGGTASTVTTGAWADVSVSQILEAGIYWLVLARQGGATTRCTISNYNQDPNPLMVKSDRSTTVNFTGWVCAVPVSGALPSTTSWSIHALIPQILARVA